MVRPTVPKGMISEPLMPNDKAFNLRTKIERQSHGGPMGYFLDAKNHKPPTFSRKIRGLRLLNVAVKERFELSIQFLVYTLSRRAP